MSRPKVVRFPLPRRSIERDGSACHHCGKIVARNRKLHSGKGRVRHKCPHGNDCGAGTARGVYSNLASNCSRCYWETGRVGQALRRIGHFDAIRTPTWTEVHAAISELGFDIPNGKPEALVLIERIDALPKKGGK